MPKTAPRHPAPPRRVVAVKPATVRSVMPELNDRIQFTLDILRRQDFEILGRLSFLTIERPNGQRESMDFRKTGPMVGQARSANLVLLVEQWNGIPPHVETSEQMCPACLAKCDICEGKGTKVCDGAWCGGLGYRAEPTGKKECLMCNGTKVKTCDACQGSGKRSTGLAGGERYDDTRVPPQQRCTSCKGRKRVNKEVAVTPADFGSRSIGPMIAVGPVVRFTIAPQEPQRPTLTYDVRADINGDYMLLLLESSAVPCAAYLIGGIPTRVNR